MTETAELQEREIRTAEEEGWRLAAMYDHDIQKLLDAAWACPITFLGNLESRQFYYAVSLIKTKRLHDTWKAQGIMTADGLMKGDKR